MNVESTRTQRRWPPGRQMLPQAIVYEGKRVRCAIAIAELARDRGAAAVTTTRITARARISRNTFYELFGGLEEALGFACTLASRRLAEPIETATAGPGDWGERVERAIHAFIAAILEDVVLAELHLFHSGRLDSAKPLAYGGATTQAFVALFEQGRKAPGVPTRLPHELEPLLAGGIVAVVARRVRRGEVESLPAISDELVRLALAPYCERAPEEGACIAASSPWQDSN